MQEPAGGGPTLDEPTNDDMKPRHLQSEDDSNRPGTAERRLDLTVRNLGRRSQTLQFHRAAEPKPTHAAKEGLEA